MNLLDLFKKKLIQDMERTRAISASRPVQIAKQIGTLGGSAMPISKPSEPVMRASSYAMQIPNYISGGVSKKVLSPLKQGVSDIRQGRTPSLKATATSLSPKSYLQGAISGLKNKEDIFNVAPSLVGVRPESKLGLGIGFAAAVATPDPLDVLTAGKAVKKASSLKKIEKLDDLLKEARKYKSAEEFVKAQNDYLYHGTNKTVFKNIQKEGIVPQRRGVSSFSTNESYARNWSDNPWTKTKGEMFRIKKDVLNGKLVKQKNRIPATDKQFEKLTNQIVQPKDIEVKTSAGWRSLLTNALSPTKSQLTDIWNEANQPVQKIKKVAGEFNPQDYIKSLVKKQDEARKVGELGVLGKAKKGVEEVKNKFVDFAAPIEDTLARAGRKGKFSIIPQGDITYQINRALRAPTIGGQFARDNGLNAVIKGTDNLDNLEQYLIAKQARDAAQRGIKTGRNLTLDEQLINTLAPKYEKQAQIVNQYSQKLLDYSVDAGLVNRKLAEELKAKYPNYVPMNRIFSEMEQGTLNNFKGGKAVASLGKQTIVQKLKGSEREIESPIKSLFERTNDAFVQGEKNKAARILGSFANLPNNPFGLEELKDTIGNKHTISFLDNGIKRTFSAPKDIAEAARALNVQQMNILGKMFATPTRVARVGITGINIPFVASNIARDQVSGFINSKNPFYTSALNVPNFIRSMYESVRHGKLYQEMVRMGGGGTSYDIARSQVPETIAKIRAGRNVFSKIAYTVKNPKEWLRTVEDVIGRSEELTRIQHYGGTKQALLKKGFSVENAMSGAAKAAQRDTVDFARRGEWGTVLNSVWLYLNANIQGTRTLMRALKERPLQTAGKIAAVGFTPVAAVTLWNLKDPKRKEAYQDIADYEKENNLIIIPPNPEKNEKGVWNVIKVPFSQEISNLMNLVRRPIEQSFSLDPVSASEVANSILGTVSPLDLDKNSLYSTLTPQAIKPALESYTNKNFFTGYNQVPESMKNLSPELQAKPYTSGTARLIGKAINKSPIKVEEFAKGTFGGITPQAFNAVDFVLSRAGAIPKEQVGGENVFSAITRRFSQARGGQAEKGAEEELTALLQKQSDTSWNLKKQAEQLHAELKKLPSEEASKRYNELVGSNPALAKKLKQVAEEDRKGLTYSERLINSLGVENGERAKYIFNELNKLKTNEEKASLYENYSRKGLISKNVAKQIQYLISTNRK